MQFLVAAHGRLAEHLVASSEMILGSNRSDLHFLNMTVDKSGDNFVAEARSLYEKYKGQQFLIFADLYGASPCNSCLSAFRNAEYRLLTGVNLPMLLESLTLKDSGMGLEELWNNVANSGVEGIRKVHLPQA